MAGMATPMGAAAERQATLGTEEMAALAAGPMALEAAAAGALGSESAQADMVAAG